jgi:hypothetical protein
MVMVSVLVVTSNMIGSFKAGSAGSSLVGMLTFGGMRTATGEVTFLTGAAVTVIVGWAG